MTIPNEVLVVPDQYIGPSGALETNTSASQVLIGALSDVNANDNPIIGKEFFSSAYLMVDLDASTFTLWQVNATDETNLVAVGGDCSEHPKVSDHITNDTSTSTTAAAMSSPTSTHNVTGTSNSGESIPTGTIVGAVLGSAFGAGALVAASLLMVSRRRRSSNRSTISTTELTSREDWKSDDSWNGQPSRHWYPANGLGLHGPAEMSASQLHPHELGAMQKPIELRGGRTPKFELDAS